MRILPRPCAGVPLHAPDHSALSVEDFWPSDRIDIHIDVPAVNYKGMRSASDPESSATIRERVVRARDLQLMRFASASRDKLCCNAQMGSRPIRSFCELSPDRERLLERARGKQGMTARAHDRPQSGKDDCGS